MVRPKALVGTIVWGESYVRNWLDYALRTWLSPGNLPALAKNVDAEFRIYTRAEDLPILNEYAIGHYLTQLMPVKIHELPRLNDSPAVNLTHEAFHGEGGIITDAFKRDQAVIYLTPDILWTDGSLGYISRSLAKNILVMAPEYRVVQETFTAEFNKSNSASDAVVQLTPGEGRRQLFRHFSPLHSCYHPESQRVPDHCEILCWPVKDEGLLIYNMSRDTGFFWPRRVKYTPQKLPDVGNNFDKFDMVQDTRMALGLGLTPLAQNLNWLRAGKPFDPVRIAQFLLCFFTSYNDIRIRKPVVLPLAERPTWDLWSKAELEAQHMFDSVAMCVNAMAMGDGAFVYPPAPPPLPEGAAPTDIELCQEALTWLEPVIAGRFEQRGLGKLRELREKYPNGDLPGYCSSWPTVLPPRP
jgi:hypothetical protein